MVASKKNLTTTRTEAAPLKRMAVIEVYPNKKHDLNYSIDAHLRNSIIVAKYLGADLLCIEDDFLKAFKKNYDVFILGYASRYAPFQSIRKLLDLNPTAKRFAIFNEYNINSISTYLPFHMIANYEEFSKKRPKSILSFSFINLNLLFAKSPNKLTEKKYDCVYYGTYRPGRDPYFKKYLQPGIFLSTSGKNFKRFAHIKCKPTFIKKLEWRPAKETLNQFRYTIYIEDEFTHTHYNNLSNRWYEAGFCNCVVFFDINCRNTVEKSELQPFKEEVEFYYVNSHQDLLNKIAWCNQDFHKHLEIQKKWRANQLQLRAEMLEKLKEIVNN